MRALIFRCFACGKISTVVVDLPEGQAMPPPPGWLMANAYAQNRETGIVVQVSVPVCQDPCQRPSERFCNLVFPVLEYILVGTVVQSAPCRIEVQDGKKPAPS